jgi:hypothetical protein
MNMTFLNPPLLEDEKALAGTGESRECIPYDSPDLPVPVNPLSPPNTTTGRGRRKLSLPAVCHPDTGELLPRYEREKAAGIRLDNGTRKLKRLQTKHYNMIALRTSGLSIDQVAVTMGVTPVTVSRVLNDPLALDVMGRVYKDRQQEVDAMAGLAVGAVREGLSSQNVDQKLRATEKWMQMKKTISSETTPEETAEDIAQNILKNAQVTGDVNIQVNRA